MLLGCFFFKRKSSSEKPRAVQVPADVFALVSSWCSARTWMCLSSLMGVMSTLNIKPANELLGYTFQLQMLLYGLHWLQKYFKNGLSGVCFYFLRAPVHGNLLCLPSLSPEIGGILLS